MAIYMLWTGDAFWFPFLLILMIIAEVTDGVDGAVARKMGTVSDVGKILDPMADSLYRISVFLGFVAAGWMPIWMFYIVLIRDICVAYLRIFSEQMNFTLAARSSGKIKAIVQGTAQIGLVVFAWLPLGIKGDAFLTLAFWALLIATAVTVYSLYDYGKSVRQLYIETKAKEKDSA